MSEPDSSQTPSQRAVEGSAGVEGIRYTGEDFQAVCDWLGDALEKTRGGLSHDDPVAVWFYCYPDGPRGGTLGGTRGFVRPGDWVVRSDSPLWGRKYMRMTDEEYHRWVVREEGSK